MIQQFFFYMEIFIKILREEAFTGGEYGMLTQQDCLEFITKNWEREMCITIFKIITVLL